MEEARGRGNAGRSLLSLLLAFILLTLLGLALSSCQTTAPPAPEFGGLPQDPGFYLDQPGLEVVASPTFQKERYAAFLAKLRAPWGPEPPSPTAEDLIEQFNDLREEEGYGEDLRLRPDSWYQDLWQQADLEAFPKQVFKAITLTSTDLRALPTAHPVFDTPQAGGDGYPFDRLQVSRVAPNTPVLALNPSRNGEWVLVACPYAWGWVRSRDLAQVREADIESWQGGSFAAVILDGTQVRDGAGRLLFIADVGAVLPLVAKDQGGYRVLAATSDDQGWASFKQASLGQEQATAMPLVLSPRNVARLAQQFLGQPYGWGGYLGNRDCSALVRDLYTPFGLWLPRNSADQAQEGGQLVPLAGTDRARVLQEQAVPFLSLLWLPGHIVIYLGQQDGQAVALHSLWRGSKIGEATSVVGRVAITSLQRGAGGGLLTRVQGFLNLVPRAQLQH